MSDDFRDSNNEVADFGNYFNQPKDGNVATPPADPLPESSSSFPDFKAPIQRPALIIIIASVALVVIVVGLVVFLHKPGLKGSPNAIPTDIAGPRNPIRR